MTEKELSEFYEYIKGISKSKKTTSDLHLKNNKETIENAYYEYEQSQINQFIKEKKEIIRLGECWTTKKCDSCSGNLRLINSDFGSFWGCSNYKDKTVKHSTFSIDYDNKSKLENVQIRINAHWATDILRTVGLNKTIKASELLQWIQFQGLDDLRVKYGYKPTMKSISGFVTAKKNSFKEESEITSQLSAFFKKPKSQFGVRYKLKGEKEKVAIMDLILADKKVVYLIEIKRTNHDLKAKQLRLYYDLMKFMLAQSKDDRICMALFLVFKKGDYDFHIPEKFLLYENVKSEKDVSKMKQLFKEHAEHNGR